MLTVGSKFQLRGTGSRAIIYTVKEVQEDDDTVTATYHSFIGLGQYTKKETAPIATQACIECK